MPTNLHTPTTTRLESQMRQLLAEMQLLPHGTTPNYNPTGAGGAPDSRMPTGESKPPHEYWARRWELAIERDEENELRESAPITKARRVVLDRAGVELDAWRKTPQVTIVSETEAELEARIVNEGQGWTVEQIAMHARCTTTFARRSRIKAGVSLLTGKPPPNVVLDLPDERERAQQLAAQGLTDRQIRMILKCGGSKVARLLGKTA